MARKLDYMDLQQIIILHFDGFSNRQIAKKKLSLSRNAVNEYMTLFRASEVPLQELMALDSASITELFRTKTTIDNERFNRLMEYFDKVNLARNYPGFTFLYHYRGYEQSDLKPYSYTQFMEHYNRKNRKVRGSMKLEHLAGHEMMIDFTGKHLHILNKETGELEPFPLRLLPFSRACLSKCVSISASKVFSRNRCNIGANVPSLPNKLLPDMN